MIECRRRQWQPTPVLLPGKSHGQRNLVGCSPWGREESDTTERLNWTELNWTGRTGCHDLCYSNQFHHPPSSFTFIKRLFNSSLVSPIRVESSAYLRLFIFLPAILTPACASSGKDFHMMYSAYRLNKRGDKMHPWHAPFPIWNQSVVPHLVLTDASCPVYRFLRRQVRWTGISISLRIFQFVVIHTSKGFSVVNEAEVDVFYGILLLFLWSNRCWQFDLWFLCLF